MYTSLPVQQNFKHEINDFAERLEKQNRTVVAKSVRISVFTVGTEPRFFSVQHQSFTWQLSN